MALTIVPKAELSERQARYLEQRLSAPEHCNDKGPPTCWRVYSSGLYAVVDEVSARPIGIIEASGPENAVNPGWWLDSRVRGQGLGGEMVDTLAAHLKAQGYTGVVGRITIDTYQGDYDTVSSKLAERFRQHFAT